MEKVKFENSRDLELVGNFWSADSEKGIVMAHGFTGSKEQYGKFTEIAEYLNQEGFNVLAFDFSGCGESEDDSITIDKEVEDLEAAVEFFKEKGVERLGILGLSQGGLVSLRYYKKNSEEVESMVLMAPLTDALENYRKDKLSKKQRKELEQKGYTKIYKEEGERDEFLIPEEAMKEKETVNQDELLEGVDVPVLFIQGENDTTITPEMTRNAVEKLDKAEMRTVEDDHYFEDSVDIAAEEAAEWFSKTI
jgi:alpha-beta hydrolase superfamily lysophospholipase